ncbi:MAG: hypothetical protein GX444_05450 [Myxococcales bacterium]|nr:hypothetical protein [Myxococcales bacterium]
MRRLIAGSLPFFLILFGFLWLMAACVDDDDSGSSPGQAQADDDDDNETADDDDDDDDDDNDSVVVPPANHPAPEWPEWVLRPWVWEDESTQESALNYVQDYLANDIPVGAIIVDSPWETGYNTFDFEPTAFPDPQEMVDTFHDLGVRVMLWITPNVNVDSPNYQEGLDNGYYVQNGATYEWWKGEGSLIDYNNPDAMDWWHGMMNNVLDLGIDGWKCDGSEYQVYLWLSVDTFTGAISPKEYQNLYYRDFFYYTRQYLGKDRVITARPVDSYMVPFWGPSFAPRDANLAGWVGDQDPTWLGMNAALINLYFSGERGYVNFGGDIGGYRSDEMRDPELFVRWAQLGAMCPIMENGGGGEHRPWMYGEEVLGIYRDFAKLHYALIPYLYSQGAEYFAAGLSVYRPLAKFEWSHMLGDEILVAPITAAGGEKEVTFPAGIWIDYFTREEYVGPSVQTLTFPLARYPIFIRQGAIIPQYLRDAGVIDPTAGEPEPITATIYPGAQGGFKVYEENGTGADIAYQVDEGQLEIRLSATARDYAFRLINATEPVEITVLPHGELTRVADLAALKAAASGWTFLENEGEIWIKPGNADQGLIINVQD